MAYWKLMPFLNFSCIYFRSLRYTFQECLWFWDTVAHKSRSRTLWVWVQIPLKGTQMGISRFGFLHEDIFPDILSCTFCICLFDGSINSSRFQSTHHDNAVVVFCADKEICKTTSVIWDILVSLWYDTINDNDMFSFSLTTIMCFVIKERYSFSA